LPMGARLRLKANIDVAQRTSDPNMQKIFRAMQKYGLIVADNGSDMYITGTYDTRWNNDILNPAFANLTASDFEVVQLGYNPAPAGQPSLNSLALNPSTVTGGQTATGTVTLTTPAPSGGVLVALSSANPAAPAALLSLTLNPTTVVGGASSIGTVKLDKPAPAGGATIALRSNKALATVPANVVVAAGATSATFSIATSTTNKKVVASITSSYRSVTKSASLTVLRR